MIKASLQNYRQSPRKVRSVANLVRGKKVSEATIILKFVNKKAGEPLLGLLDSAIANAKHNFKIEDTADLIIKDMRVDAGYVLKRRMPRARGMAYPINKRTSHVLMTLVEPVTKPALTAKSLPKPSAKTTKVAKDTLKAKAK